LIADICLDWHRLVFLRSTVHMEKHLMVLKRLSYDYSAKHLWSKRQRRGMDDGRSSINCEDVFVTQSGNPNIRQWGLGLERSHSFNSCNIQTDIRRQILNEPYYLCSQLSEQCRTYRFQEGLLRNVRCTCWGKEERRMNEVTFCIHIPRRQLAEVSHI
jgi:hypothetical protein